MKILVDENVAGLARWLRFMGFDTKQVERGIPDSEVLSQAKREERVLITRDSILANEASGVRVIPIDSDRFIDQLRAVIDALGMTDAQAWFSLCTECNRPLQTLDEGQLLNHPAIPDFVKKSTDPHVHCAWTCAQCQRVFWRGSHYERTRDFLTGLEGN